MQTGGKQEGHRVSRSKPTYAASLASNAEADVKIIMKSVMYQKFGVLLCVGTLLACESGTVQSGLDQSPSINPLESKNGTRIQHKIVSAEDGLQVPMGLFDTKLGDDCAFSEAEDGKQRCLPTKTASFGAPDFLNAVNQGTHILYKDVNCNDRVAFSSLCSPSVKYIKYSDTCGSKTKIGNATEISLPDALYYRSINGICSMVSTNYAAFKELRAYVLGMSLPPEEFVAATVTMSNR